MNGAAFGNAVSQVALFSKNLLASLVNSASLRDRELEEGEMEK